MCSSELSTHVSTKNSQASPSEKCIEISMPLQSLQPLSVCETKKHLTVKTQTLRRLRIEIPTRGKGMIRVEEATFDDS